MTRGEQLLQIVRSLDQEMNNTSVILLFQIGKKKLLFPGDAQIENWQFALQQKKYRSLLSSVNLYKVGHHGSRNATPKSLWKLFKNKSERRPPIAFSP
jgi:beta-lactamase superfamily II metal-dependent hydrolase